MSFDRAALADYAKDAPLARIVVAESRGSAPREAGTWMIVGESWTEGTIGGGALEFEAVHGAREALALRTDRLDRVPLGPALGQCCGGAVTLLTEVWDEARLAALPEEAAARPLPGADAPATLAVHRALRDKARTRADLRLVDGWVIEPYTDCPREIWVWGAGHVGRAVVDVIAPLPGISVMWADFDRDRFPLNIPAGVEILIASRPERLAGLSAPHAEHYVMTHSHALDLEICHRVLRRGSAFLGLIGSATKRARFMSRLKALGLDQTTLSRLVCPIGDPSLGKHPREIAIGVAVEILGRERSVIAASEAEA